MSALVGFVILVALLAFISLGDNAGIGNETPAATSDDRFYQIVEALHKAVKSLYVNRDKYVNLDGLIGPRQMEGILYGILWSSNIELPKHMRSALVNLYWESIATSWEMENIIAHRLPKYYTRIYPLIQQDFWNAFHPSKSHSRAKFPPVQSTTKHYSSKPNTNLTEYFSDGCIAELVGTDGHLPCEISPQCWNQMMFGADFNRYSLTHQVFYFQTGIQAGCEEKISALLHLQYHLSPEQWSERKCNAILTEATELVHNSTPLRDNDLLMEQIGFCGYIGYLDVAKWEWLPMILQWQHDSGCYGSLAGQDNKSLAEEGADPQHRNYGLEKRAPQMTSAKMVVDKRVEVAMGTSDGCLSHTTAVAISALSVYLRKTVDQL